MNTDFSALSHIDWERFLPLLLIYISINLILLSCACIDWFRCKDRIATPAIWLMVILLVQPIGSILYFVIGRRTMA
ncbi:MULTISPECIES: PLDc N-terminal domain-containing protein [unclassified Exiguobacterium]|uniref:PLDc N-terminal domain-containing protein n=1 Tax=unclassified Exiguobacterium TaxID=2644629 RepID=UPI001BE5B1E5|nr:MULTISPECIES: PLDc N-terminal domain-containing protein [unclassified Exiguobacterium]